MKFAQRDLIILNVESDHAASAGGIPRDRDYLLLLPAYTLTEKEIFCSTASMLIGPRCREVCCVGQFAADLECDLDFALEQSGRLDIVTTAFHDSEEALEYVLFAARGAQPNLCIVAAVERHAELARSISLLSART